MLRSLLIIFLLIPGLASAKELSWADIESRVLGSNLEVQSQVNTSNAAEKESKAASGAFLPSVSLNAGTGRDTTVRDDDRGTQAFVEGKWNLYRGGRDAALKEKSKTVAGLEQINLDLKKREVLFKARELFVSLLAIKKSIEVLSREDELNKQQKGMAQKKVTAGLTSNVDEIEFDLRSDMIAAESSRLLSEQEARTAELKALLDFNENNFSVIGDLTVPQNRELRSVDLSRSPLVSSSEMELKMSEADKRIARSGFMPEINLSAAYGRQTLQQDEPIKNNETTAILSVTLPIFTGFETMNLSKAQAERVSAKEKQLRQTQNNLRANEQSLKSRWKEVWTLYDLNQKTLERAKKYYQLTLSEYRRGIKNSPDLVSATERLFEAEMKSLSLAKELILIQADFEKTF